MSIENPFPVEGIVVAKDHGFRASLPCASEWLEHSEYGNKLQAAADRIYRKHGEDVEVRVLFTDDGHGAVKDYKLLGPVKDNGSN